MLVDDTANVRASDRVLGIVSVGTLDIDGVLAGDDIGERDVDFGGGGGDWNRWVTKISGDDTGVVTPRQPCHPFREQEIREALHGLGTEVVAVSAMKMGWVRGRDVVSHGGRRRILSGANSGEPDC